MSRIDHAGKARQILAEIPDGATEAETMAWCAEAQVHAQLAIAEQQRVGNMIALMASAARGVSDQIHSVQAYMEMFNRLNPQVSKALGLNEGENDE